MTAKWTRDRPGPYTRYVNGKSGLIIRMAHSPRERRWWVKWESMFGKHEREVATLAEAKRVVSRGY